MNTPRASDEPSVASLYKDAEVAETYIQKRFRHAWSRLLHQQQVAEVNRVLQTFQPENVLEIAPGPARLAIDLQGIRRGMMLDSSAEMLALARQRLAAAGLDKLWDIRCGNAFELEALGYQCDFLYTFRFVRHFPYNERMRLYHGITTCLRPHGLLMFDVVNRSVRQRLDAKQPAKSQGELDIYDETYTAHTFAAEMASCGFELVRMTPSIKHFALQSWLSLRLDHRCASVSNFLVNGLEKVPSSQPLEWIALCRKMS
jgi:SAM-dependent methyltransferase